MIPLSFPRERPVSFYVRAGCALNQISLLDHRLVFNPSLSCCQDAGVRAFVSGLAVASSKRMLGTSLNERATNKIEGCSRCQKPHSGYIWLIKEWREEVVGKDGDDFVRLFPYDIAK